MYPHQSQLTTQHVSPEPTGQAAGIVKAGAQTVLQFKPLSVHGAEKKY